MQDGVVEIARLGAQGDGVVDAPGGPAFVPFALPGERWRHEPEGWRQLSASPDRAAPVCRHFGRCGGCAAQHMPAALYRSWKRGIVVEAFGHRGIEAEIAPLVEVPSASRRRAVLSAVRTREGAVIGFCEAGSSHIVDMTECPVLEPAIVAALPGLRDMIAELCAPRQEARLRVTATADGLDVTIEGAPGPAGPDARARLARIARSTGIVRLHVAGELVVLAASPTLAFGPATVTLPPGGFVQAVAAAEQAIAARVVAAVGKARRIADLFCGPGTLTFPLARTAAVTALDSDAGAIAALTDAARRAQGLKPIDARRRDLYRDPLSRKELDAFDAVVLDPPRAGARAQCERLAASKVARIAMVSCNPATMARDVRCLMDGGYKLGPVTPIDQFVYAPHVECVAELWR